MKQLQLFLVAAIMAVLTGCPVTPSDHDQGINPSGDAGPDSDGNIDLPDAGPDSEVLPDSGTDTGTDGGPVADPCADPEYVGTECNLPEGVPYSRDTFLCAGAIDNDLWVREGLTTPTAEDSREVDGVLYSSLSFARSGMSYPAGARIEFTCGPEGVCWYNWTNMSSNYSRCRVSFLADCSGATIECWPPGASTPVTSHAVYVGPA